MLNVEAANALESYGWAVVKHAQYYKAGKEYLTAKWHNLAIMRYSVYEMLRKAVSSSRKFKAGVPPSIGQVDVFVPGLLPKIMYKVDASVALFVFGPYIKAWRYAV